MQKERIIVATGVFDILHPGHIAYLQQAKALGTKLVVILARDITAKRRKRIPFNNEQIRLTLVQALRCVDAVVLGSTDAQNHIDTLIAVHPDVLVLGHDQHIDTANVQRDFFAKTGKHIEVVQLEKYIGNHASTRNLLQAIHDYVARGNSHG